LTGPLREAVDAATATQPVLVFLAGPNGAGKSTFHRIYLEELGLPFVNADAFAKALRDAGRAKDADREAFSKAEDLRRTLVEGRVSFCTESVFSDAVGAKLDLLRKARALGFAAFLVFVGLESSELSLARVVQRVSAGGHDVPDDRIASRFPRTLSNLRAALSIVDEAFLFDNSSADEPFRFVAEYRGGHLVRRAATPPRWAADLPGL